MDSPLKKRLAVRQEVPQNVPADPDLPHAVLAQQVTRLSKQAELDKVFMDESRVIINDHAQALQVMSNFYKLLRTDINTVMQQLGSNDQELKQNLKKLEETVTNQDNANNQPTEDTRNALAALEREMTVYRQLVSEGAAARPSGIPDASNEIKRIELMIGKIRK